MGIIIYNSTFNMEFIMRAFDRSNELYEEHCVVRIADTTSNMLPRDTWVRVMEIMGVRDKYEVSPTLAKCWKEGREMTLHDISLVDTNGRAIISSHESCPRMVLMALFSEIKSIPYMSFRKQAYIRGFGGVWDRWAKNGFLSHEAPAIELIDPSKGMEIDNFHFVE